MHSHRTPSTKNSVVWCVGVFGRVFSSSLIFRARSLFVRPGSDGSAAYALNLQTLLVLWHPLFIIQLQTLQGDDDLARSY